ncbi:MAG: undecaprenyldiphospho-muramoylpentapeptide beta-N-acetylglucosaminyltransferase [Anaerolineaceae bacterium]|mgnify:CR=1 FL=1|nr:undecaprenyldiphospho-muramoylpentapeptide beta-N-acetylglucosaminyltransferase [Anaerolineaceae bacterium]|tara:strand:- start:12097 stop:13185 length:1089 start_codon:yes stop_codon:yes gene_type:complete
MIKMILIVAGGGTGGHIYPGLAVAHELLSRQGKHKVIFVGKAKGLEAKLVAGEKVEFFGLNVRGIKGSGLVMAVWSVMLLVGAIVRSIKMLLVKSPDAVLGVGGYASAPMGLAALVLGIPLAITEQNTKPGLTNRWLGRFAKRIFLAWPESEQLFPNGKWMVTGNPVRHEFFVATKKSSSKLMNILVIGGSQGAKSLNKAMAEAVPLLNSVAEKITLVHQTGAFDIEMIKSLYEKSQFKCEAFAFLTDMPQRIADADLVISRSGAGAVFEICAVGRAAIYVPFPHAAEDHQLNNAEAVTASGGATIINDSNFDGKTVASLVKSFLKPGKRLERMGDRARGLAKPEAAGTIVDELLKMKEAPA